MWDDDDYGTPRYLLWISIGLGAVMGVLSSGALIKALVTESDTIDFVALLGVILLIVLSFLLVTIGFRSMREAPEGSEKV